MKTHVFVAIALLGVLIPKLNRAYAGLQDYFYVDGCPEPSIFYQKAVVYSKHGDSSVLRKANVAIPARTTSRQMLIKIYASAANPVDFKLRRMPSPVVPLPHGVGFDFAGVVVEPDDEGKFKANDKVYGMLPIVNCDQGTLREFLVAEAQHVALMPKVSFAEAASLPLVALTVMQGMSHGVPLAVDFSQATAFVHAGSGGIGTFALQYLRNVLRFQNVITTSSQEKLCASLGATRVINYKTSDYATVVEPRSIDVLIDPLGGVDTHRSFKLVKHGSAFVSILNDGWQSYTGVSVLSPLMEGVYLFSLNWLEYLIGFGPTYHTTVVYPSGTQLKRLTELVDSKLVKPVIDSEFKCPTTWEECGPAMHEWLESGKAHGKVVVSVSQ